ncbi:MAG TPA: hypothetical protein VFE62_15745, partial [Gemmataceae bacterium]|nr:hypothetical protein [Gemmataceae bacterium]
MTLLVCLELWLPASSQAASKQEVDKAIDRGVKFLKESQQVDGSWNYAAPGATALAGLALLESGLVKPADPVVRKTAVYLRAHGEETGTYSLALMIFFFDRLAESRDKYLIKQLGERLRDGQLEGGGWTYTCTARPEGRGSSSIRRDRSRPASGNFQPLVGEGGGDNSNTQFGLMGLWVARR